LGGSKRESKLLDAGELEEQQKAIDDDDDGQRNEINSGGRDRGPLVLPFLFDIASPDCGLGCLRMNY
jgi:hypothetical protein